MNRRNFLSGIAATFALTTGLARAKLELVDDEPLMFKGVPIYFDSLDGCDICGGAHSNDYHMWLDWWQAWQANSTRAV